MFDVVVHVAEMVVVEYAHGSRETLAPGIKELRKVLKDYDTAIEKWKRSHANV